MASCECGCGETTNINRATGQPRRFLLNHDKRSSPDEYLIEDRGFTSPCWIWQRYIGKAGYGLTRVDGRGTTAHRRYYENFIGPIPHGFHVDHLCFVRACVNPDHLEAVEPVVNVRRQRNILLTFEDAEQIRRLVRSQSHREIAERFGIAVATVSSVVSRKCWKAAAHG